ncbi:MAG: DUF1028 domain-containing protein [Halolamina sp.]
MTFSIAARDPDTGQYGVAIASVFPAVGAVCPWVSGDGALSTQSWDSGADYGEAALELLARDISLPAASALLVEERDGGIGTQLHGVEADGTTHAYTGEKCVEWAGHLVGENHTVAGNMLVGEEVIEATSDAFKEATGRFTSRLLTALEAGEAAGGDKRGDNLSAAVLVHAETPKLYHNLRVDTPGQPIADLWDAYEAAVETERGMDDEEMAEFWGGPVPDSVRNYLIRY